jgi:hypothetical protein
MGLSCALFHQKLFDYYVATILFFPMRPLLFLNNARQSEIVDIVEWADMLLALAHKAFHDLPGEYVTKQVVIKLCQGCIDKNIGSVAASLTFSKVLFNTVLLCSNLLTSV